MTNDSLLLSSESFFRPLGLHHVYDAFALNAKANVRQDALLQFQLEETELTSDLRLTAAAVRRKMWGQRQEQPLAPPARSARHDPPGKEGAAAPADDTSEGSTDTEDTDQEAAIEGNTRTPLADDIQQYDLIKAAYREVGHEFKVNTGAPQGGLDQLQSLASVPRRWPLASLTIPLLKSVEYLDRS